MEPKSRLATTASARVKKTTVPSMPISLETRQARRRHGNQEPQGAVGQRQAEAAR